MSNKDMKNEIKAAFAEETPDALQGILDELECESAALHGSDVAVHAPRASLKRRRPPLCKYSCIAAALLLVFTIGILLGKCIGMHCIDPGELPDDTVNVGDNNGDGSTGGNGNTDGSGNTDGDGSADGEGNTDGGNGGTGNEEPPIIIETASLIIDVNPSVELRVDTAGTVVGCIAGNADADKILGDMKLEGVNMKTALYAIIGSMYMNGFLTNDDNYMLVSMKSDSEKFENLLSDVVDNVNEIMEASDISCSIVAQDVSESTDSETVAKENNISLGKLSLINKIIDGAEDYVEEDIAELSKLDIKDLNRLFAYVKDKEKQEPPAGGGGRPDGGKGEKDEIMSDMFGAEELAAQLAVAHLEQQLSLEIDTSELASLDVRLSRHETGNRFEIKIGYTVTFVYSETFYTYRVDTDAEVAELVSSQPADPIGGPTGGRPQDPPSGSDPQDPPSGNDPQDPPSGNDPQDPPSGSDPHDPPNGGDPQDPPNGSDPHDPPSGNDPQDPPSGSDPQNPPSGNDPQDPPSGSDPQDPPSGSDPHDPPSGSDPQDPPSGSDPQNPPSGSDPQDPPSGRDPQDPPSGSDPQAPPSGRDPQDPPSGSDPQDPPSGAGH